MKSPIKSIAVYCGSNTGNNPIYTEMAKQVATIIVQSGLTVIYGGGKVGLMGTLANTALNLGGQVVGVIPQSLVDQEVAHEGLTDLHIVNSMHERKLLMAKLSDGFIMLPGGPGTWEEFFEMMTWAKLGYHQKPCGILNTNNYYDLIIKFLDQAVNEKFLHPSHRDMILIDTSPNNLLDKFFNYEAPVASPWFNKLINV